MNTRWLKLLCLLLGCQWSHPRRKVFTVILILSSTTPYLPSCPVVDTNDWVKKLNDLAKSGADHALDYIAETLINEEAILKQHVGILQAKLDEAKQSSWESLGQEKRREARKVASQAREAIRTSYD